MPIKNIVQTILSEKNNDTSFAEKLIKEFVYKKCKEQRILCFNQAMLNAAGDYIVNRDDILNAPAPLFDFPPDTEEKR